MSKGNCQNLNHGRRDPPVRGCPMCGEIVNSKIPAKHCSQTVHADRRRSGDMYCIDCMERLRTA